MAMAEGGIQDVQSRARILLICPDCGHENTELADVLRSGTGTYYCRGDDCDYIFDLMPGRRDYGKSFIEACKRFYGVLHAPRRLGAR